MAAIGSRAGASLPIALVWVGALGLALVTAAAIFVAPTPWLLLPPAALAGSLVVFGVESLIALCFLGAAGILPFVDTGGYAVANLPVWVLFFALGCGLMLLAWGTRVVARRPSRPLEPNVLVVLLAVYFVFVVIRLAASEPLSIPSLTAQFVGFPTAALVTYAWLSHDEALAGLRRALPVIIVVAGLWAVAYIGGSAGCGVCREWVDAGRVRGGLLGEDSRLYTAGQNVVLALALVAFGQMLRRFTPGVTILALVGAGAIALQASRAQYFAFLAGVLVLLIWKFGRVRVVGRLLLVLATVVAVVALLSTPAGDRALTAYQDVASQGGTAGVRLGLLQTSAENWSVLGFGVYSQLAGKGYHEDLGLPNTLLVLGYVGAFLQIAVLLAGLVRGAVSRTLAGATVAAICVMVLVARPTLPLVESGNSGVAYGMALGFAAALHTGAGGLRRSSPLLSSTR